MAEYKVGDTVRVIETRQTAKIIAKGSLALPRADDTTWTVLPESGGPSVTVLPEQIKPLQPTALVALCQFDKMRFDKMRVTFAVPATKIPLVK